jgi:hypothetical protein
MPKEPLVPQPESGPRTCPNCHAVATHAFCPKCGQATHGLRASFRQLIGDFLTVWFGAEAKSWRSLKLMVRKPGALCLEYQQGRRARYVPPLRMYLFLSVMMLLVAKCQGNLNDAAIFSTNSKAAHEAPQLEDDDVGDLEEKLVDSSLNKDSWWQGPIYNMLKKRAYRFDRMSAAEQSRAVSREMIANVPVALLFLLPLLALYLRILWIKSGPIYFDHFIFSLQFQAFLFALFTILILTPFNTQVEGFIAFLYPPTYLTLAQRRVVQGPWWRCIFNTLALGPLLALTSLALVIGLAGVSVLMV